MSRLHREEPSLTGKLLTPSGQAWELPQTGLIRTGPWRRGAGGTTCPFAHEISHPHCLQGQKGENFLVQSQVPVLKTGTRKSVSNPQ